MASDALTLAALIVSIAVVIAVLVLIRNGNKRNEELIREVAHQTSLVAEEDEARELCRVIHKMYPEACPGLDFTIRCKNGRATLDCWNLKSPAPGVEGRDSTPS